MGFTGVIKRNFTAIDQEALDSILADPSLKNPTIEKLNTRYAFMVGAIAIASAAAVIVLLYKYVIKPSRGSSTVNVITPGYGPSEYVPPQQYAPQQYAPQYATTPTQLDYNVAVQ